MVCIFCSKKRWSNTLQDLVVATERGEIAQYLLVMDDNMKGIEL